MPSVLTVVETFISNPLFGLAVALVLTVIGWKLNTDASNWLLLVAWALTIVSIYRTNPVSRQPFIAKVLLTMFFGSIVGLGLYKLSGWQPNQAKEIADEVAKRLPSTPKEDESRKTEREVIPSKPLISDPTGTGTLVPDNKPEPIITIPPHSIPAPLRALGETEEHENIELARAIAAIPKDALRVYVGGNIGWTLGAEIKVIWIAGRDLLTLHRQNGGILINASIFTENGKIVVDIEKNAVHINNQNQDYFYHDQDAHSLLVKDQAGDTVLDIKYLNPNVVSVLGVFRYKDRTLYVYEDRMVGPHTDYSVNILKDPNPAIIRVY
jgi:hypothetical protein